MTTNEMLLTLFGTASEVPPRRVLTAGPLSAELEAGNLRHIRLAGREAIRAVSYIVRDHEWGTLAPRISELAVEQGAEHFRVTYRATCQEGGQRFDYAARIEGRPDGLEFAVEGNAVTDVNTARIGFVVLHPIDGVSGTPAIIEHVDGNHDETVFPALIAPYQPFMEVRAITHAVAPGLRVTCRMEGDTFETEDQRNWTDASYKTYVRPIGLPWPFLIRRGESTHQRVTLGFSGSAPAAAPESPAVRVALGAPQGVLPAVCLQVDPAEPPGAPELERVRALGPTALRCRFDARRHGAAEMAGFAALAAATGARVVLETVLPAAGDLDAEAAGIAALAGAAGLRPESVVAVPAPDMKGVTPGKPWPACPPLEAVYRAARAAFPQARLGGGTYCFFAEFNRKRPPVAALDFVTHSTGAIYHAGDDVSAMETLGCLPAVFASGKAIAAGRGYETAFGAIGCMDNPFGVAAAPNPDQTRRPMARQDPRQRGLFGAAWTLGYLSRAADAGLAAATPGAVGGAFAVADADGRLRPLFHVLRGLARHAGRPLRPAVSSRPDAVLALAVTSGDDLEVWLGNLGAPERSVTLTLPLPARVALLDAAAAAAAAQDAAFLDHLTGDLPSGAALLLPSYAVARLLVAGGAAG
jgi:hypothetical protein